MMLPLRIELAMTLTALTSELGASVLRPRALASGNGIAIAARTIVILASKTSRDPGQQRRGRSRVPDRIVFRPAEQDRNGIGSQGRRGFWRFPHRPSLTSNSLCAGSPSTKQLLVADGRHGRL